MSDRPSSVKSKGHTSRWQRLRESAPPTWRRIRGSWRIFAQNRLAVFGVVLIVVFAIMAIAHPVLMATVWRPARVYLPETGFDPDVIHPALPSLRHILGTDVLGRDILSMLLASTTSAFVVGLTAALSAATVGLAIGVIAAYYRGRVEAIFMHLADALLLLPAPLFMVIVGAQFEINSIQFGLLYGLIAGAGSVAIVMRSYALTLVSKSYIDAARVAGAGNWHIIFRHLIPQMLPLAAVHMMLAVTGAVVADGFLTYTGLRQDRLNWGYMVNLSFEWAPITGDKVQWNLVIPPAMSLSLFAAAFYLVSRGLHEVTDPRLRKT